MDDHNIVLSLNHGILVRVEILNEYRIKQLWGAISSIDLMWSKFGIIWYYSTEDQSEINIITKHEPL